MAAMSSKAAPELLREQCFLPSGFPGEVREEQEEGQQRAVPADGESRAGKHQENPSIDGVANVRVGAGADQFVFNFQGNSSAPIAADVNAGPNGKGHAGKRQDRAQPSHREGEWNKPPAEKAAVPEIGVQEQQRRNDYGQAREARPGGLSLP